MLSLKVCWIPAGRDLASVNPARCPPSSSGVGATGDLSQIQTGDAGPDADGSPSLLSVGTSWNRILRRCSLR